MHTHSLLCSMSRLPHLTVCLVGALLLMPFCRAQESDFEEYDTTPDYDDDFNTTIEYSFFSNSSADELDKFLQEVGDTGDVERNTEVTPTQEVTEGEEEVTVEMEEEEEEEEETVEMTITIPPTLARVPVKDETYN
ncbi:uncharacterized protein si:ch211-191i18.2 [Sardina pilchardus]|uniref:uncharacterized protein si:ch211-191i18.2 n=1 Tax=Sardina pilchardus TaxID=27697 RepID=UPI002E15B2FB